MFDQITSLDIVQCLNLLENLNVSHTSIDDDGLVAVMNHPSLASLNLLSTNVSDNGLQYLQGEEIIKKIILSTNNNYLLGGLVSQLQDLNYTCL